jgi:alpha-1,2-mannosyltransferase
VGVGLATAIKLTPGIFILYLLLARRFRAAGVAIATSAAATILAAAIMPTGSRIFWTDALWDTDRVGSMSFISNQSLEGFVARLDPADPSMPLWAGLVLVILAGWAWRIRRATRLGDDRAGLALTGVVGCLISPVTWTHHLVWLLPALLLLTTRGLLAAGRRRVALSAFAIGLYVLFSSKLVWSFYDHFTGWGLLCANAYIWGSVLLLFGLPLVPGSAAPGVADLVEVDDATVRAPDGVAGPAAVLDKAGNLVEPSGGLVRLQHP